jgi:hypothetical protein
MGRLKRQDRLPSEHANIANVKLLRNAICAFCGALRNAQAERHLKSHEKSSLVKSWQAGETG